MIPQNLFTRKGLLSLLDRLLVPLIIVSVALASFALGRLSMGGEGAGKLIIHPPGDPSGVAKPIERNSTDPRGAQSKTETAHNFVASKNGSKYYLPTCAGANNIKEENKVWFASAAVAEAAGYSPAANCTF